MAARTAEELPELGRQQDWREAREAGGREWAAAGPPAAATSSADAPSSSAVARARGQPPGHRPPAVGGRSATVACRAA